MLIEISDLPEEALNIFGKISAISYPKQGCTSDVAIVDCCNGRYVIKRSSGHKYCRWLEQEYRVLEGVSKTPLIVPKPSLFVKNDKYEIPECWIVMGYLEGDTLRNVLERTDKDDKRRKLIYHFGKALFEIHSTAFADKLFDDERPWLDRKLDEAEFYLKHYKVDGTPELLEYLRSSRPKAVQAALIHGDFTLDNVLIKDDEVTGIIDWSGGAYGDPRYDIALAIRPANYCFKVEEDFTAFFDGYGSEPISREEYDYFNGIYEFF